MDAHRIADRAALAVTRVIIASEVASPLERAEVLHLLVERLSQRRDADLRLARVDDGVSYGQICRILGMTRQAARRRFATPPSR